MDVKEEVIIPLYMGEEEEVIDLTGDSDDDDDVFEVIPATPEMGPRKPLLEPPLLNYPSRKYRGFLDQFGKDDIVQLPAAQPIPLFNDDEDEEEFLFDVEKVTGIKRPLLYEEVRGTPKLKPLDLISPNVDDISEMQTLGDYMASEEDDEDDTPLITEDEDGKKKKQGAATVRWCITYNNPTVTCKQLIEMMERSGKVKGYAFQKEVSRSGTPHMQMYIEFSDKGQRATGVRKVLGTNALSTFKCRGSKKANIIYCTKEDTRVEGPFVWGTCLDNKSGNQGERTDINELYAMISEKEKITNEMREMYPGLFIRYAKNIEKVLHDVRVERMKKKEKEQFKEIAMEIRKYGKIINGQRQRHIELFVGPTGCGKTTIAKATAAWRDEDLYEKDGKNKWWDSYKDEPAVLIDEWVGQDYGSIEQFNRMTNLGVYQGETKGGHILLTADSLYFTTNRLPIHWWKKTSGSDDEASYFGWNEARYQAVARRFAIIHWWDDKRNYRRLVNPNKGGDKNAWEAFWKWDSRDDAYTIEGVGKGIFEQKIQKNKIGYFDPPSGLVDYPITEPTIE